MGETLAPARSYLISLASKLVRRAAIRAVPCRDGQDPPRIPAARAYATVETFALSSTPSALFTASVVFKVGFPFSLKRAIQLLAGKPGFTSYLGHALSACNDNQRVRDLAGVILL